MWARLASVSEPVQVVALRLRAGAGRPPVLSSPPDTRAPEDDLRDCHLPGDLVGPLIDNSHLAFGHLKFIPVLSVHYIICMLKIF